MQHLKLLPSEGPRFTNTSEHIAYLEKENCRLHETIEKLRQFIKQLQAFLSWEDKLFATPSEVMSDGEKVIARLVPRVEKQAKKREQEFATTDTRDDGLVRVFPNEFVEGSGKNEKRVGATLKRLDELGLVDYKVERKYDKKAGTPKTQSLMSSTPQLATLEVNVTDPRNKGNNQKNFVLCKSCGTELVQVKKVLQGICPNCGEVHIYDPSKKEDKAYIVTAETADNFEEWYGDVEPGDLEDMLAVTMPRVEAITEPIPVIQQEPGGYLAQASPEASQAREELARREFAAMQAARDIPPVPFKPMIEPILTMPVIRLPWGCHCQLKSNWVVVNGVSHCRACEPEYRSY